MRQFLIAFQFLTVIPIEISGEINERDFGRSLSYFPVVGLFLGGLLMLTAKIFYFLPSMVISGLVILVSVLSTGGLHLDGLADTCDGLYGKRSKEQALEIMRDSNIGAMGAIGICLILIIKFSIISSMPKDLLLKLLLVMPVYARWAQVLSCFISDYARVEGKAVSFINYVEKTQMLTASVFTLFVFIVLFHIIGGIIFLLSIILTCSIIYWIKRRINGMTGDTIGAVSELSEIFVLLAGLVILV